MSVVNTNEGVDTDGLEFEGYNDAAAAADKTYLLLEVQNFNGDNSQSINGITAGGGLNSYLWLGAPGSTSENRRGEDYAELVADPSTTRYNATYDSPYIDDDRVRNDANLSSNPYFRLSTNERSAETTVLHTRGGWRDHTDGNRITTTRGDKVEVIGGNYKLIIMGRRQWTDGRAGANAVGALNWESSGGITYLYDQVPGQVVDARWVQDLNGTFRVKEQTTKGNVVERYDGMKKEWFFGTAIQDRVGSIDVYDAAGSTTPTIPSAKDIAKGTATSTVSADGFPKCDDFDQLPAEYEQTGVWPPTDNYTRTDLSDDATGVTPPAADATFVGYAPDIKETTWAYATMEREWAKKIVERRGSSNKIIPSIKEYDYAEVIEEYMEVIDYRQNVYLKNDYGHNGSMKFRDYIKVDSNSRINEKQAAEFTGNYDGDAVEVWGAAITEDIPMGANFAECYAGSHFSLRFGLSLTAFLGMSFDFHLLQPLTIQLNILARLQRLGFLNYHKESNAAYHLKMGFGRTQIKGTWNHFGLVKDESGAQTHLG